MSNHSFVTDLGVLSPGAKGPPAIGPKIVGEFEEGGVGIVKRTCYLYSHGNFGRDEIPAELRIKRAVCVPRVIIEDKTGGERVS